MKDFAGKTALITGGSTGIGFGMATVFATAGMNVAITDIRQDALDRAERELNQVSGNVLALHADSTDPASLEAAGEVLSERFGPLHVLCNNAGVPGGGRVLETPMNQWRERLEVNLWGVLNGIKTFLPGMLEHEEAGHIVNTASFSGIYGHGHQSAYGTSKFAVVGLSEFLSNDLAPTKLSVSVLCPHVVDTPVISALKQRVTQEVAQRIHEMAVPAETVGRQVLNAIRAEEFYVFCDGTHTREMLAQHCNDLMAAMDRQFPP